MKEFEVKRGGGTLTTGKGCDPVSKIGHEKGGKKGVACGEDWHDRFEKSQSIV